MGVFVGDALGLGCHWYYNTDNLQAEYGPWVDNYRDNSPERTDTFGYIAKYRYDLGLRAGDLSQTGQLNALLLESVAEQAGYDEVDFTARLDAFFESLDGSDLSGRFSDWAVRDTWRHRQLGMAWHEAGSLADTSEAAQRAVILAARYAGNYHELGRLAHSNIRLTHRDRYVAGCSLTFALAVALLINGISCRDVGNESGRLFRDPTLSPMLASFDVSHQVGNGSTGWPEVDVDPRDVCKIYGLACTLGFMAPAAYYLIHRFPDDFESAVLYAVNAGGNNMARAALTGALSGALVGVQGIPERFIAGLEDSDRLLQLAKAVAVAAEEG